MHFDLSAVGFGDEHPVGGAAVRFLIDLPGFARYGLGRRGAGLIRGWSGDLAVISGGDEDASADARQDGDAGRTDTDPCSDSHLIQPFWL